MVVCGGSVMVVSWWFVVVQSWWFSCGGFVVVCGGLWWFHGGSWWFVVVQSWWFCGGSWWFVMFHYHGFVVVHGGLWWFVMCYSLKFSRKTSCDPLFSQSGSQIHYQISFLMRLAICPFPFKEHTSKELC